MFQRLLLAGMLVQLGVSTGFSQINIDAGVNVDAGGTATASGFIHNPPSSASNFFMIEATEGDLVSLRITRFTTVGLFPTTSFFGGRAVATLRRNSAMVQVRGTCNAYVDDLEGFPGFPDRIVVHFAPSDGTAPAVCNGAVFKGDIRINVQ